MYLQKLEIIGFKSFAEKTELDFLPPSDASQGITCIVGPNGSGKSNVADALRWVLGEQSIKLLRGKKAEDVIFSGSEKRARSGFAEATIHLNNEDGRLPIDYTEVSITRRVYRDGESEYLINKSKVRLTDIQMLLAQAQFSARSYSVIGQGMTDSILVASPQERKEFLDEAAGVRQFQIKRQQSVSKMDATRENLGQADMLLNEIEPRLRSLARQVKRLEARDALEEELHALNHQYYGRLWHDLKGQIDARQATLQELETAWKERESTLTDAQSELQGLESQEKETDTFSELQARYEQLVEEKARLRDRETAAKGRIEVAEQVRQKTATTMPLSKIIQEVDGISAGQGAAIGKLKASSTLEEAKGSVSEFEGVQAATVSLRERLERPAPEEQPAPTSPALLKELEETAALITAQDVKIRLIQAELQEYNRGERQKKEKFFALQRGLQEKVSAAHELERHLGNERVEMARLDTRREALEAEMTAELGEKASHVKESFSPSGTESVDELAAQVQKVKYQLNLIGGIDPEVVREYEETNGRHEFLETQTTDLRKAIEDLERVIGELDVTIKARSESAFRQINRDFDRYFKILFGGGKAELIQLMSEPEEEEEGAPEAAEGQPTEKKEEQPKTGTMPEQIVGIDILATPPGKKIKNIAMLSGGERSLVSIALICAIMTHNPSPFVVLDEVDAALDESNADKFASILADLAVKTQFIIITHNRYTMKRANVLYGVTMREDGTSMLLSVNLDEVADLKNQVRQKVAV
jgi:chromosome segregation protein